MADFKQKVTLELVDKFTATAKGVDNSLKALLGGMKGLAGAVGIGAVGAALTASVKAFAEAEKSTKQLEVALKAAGVTSRVVLDDYNAFSKTIQTTTEFTEEQAQSVLRLYTQYGIFGEEAKKATKLAADLASAMGTDLQSAALTLAKASEGNVQGLQRLGIKFKDGENSAQDFGDVLDAVGQKFGGFSEAIQGTTAGSIDQVKKNFGEIAESLGRIVANADRAIGASSLLKSALGGIADTLEGRQSTTSESIAFLEKQIEFNKTLQADTSKVNETLRGRIELLKEIQRKEESIASQRKKEFEDESKGQKEKELQKEQLKNFEQYMSDRALANAEGIEKIKLQELRNLKEIDQMVEQKKIGHEQAEEAKVRVSEDANRKILESQRAATTEMLGQMSSFLSGWTNDVTQNVFTATQKIGDAILPGLGTAFKSFSETAIQIIDAFTTKYVSSAEKIMQVNNKLLDFLNNISSVVDLEKEAEKRAKETGLVDLLDPGESTIQSLAEEAVNIDAITSAGDRASQIKSAADAIRRLFAKPGGRVQLSYARDPETGVLGISYQDRQIAAQRDDGSLIIYGKLPGTDSEAETEKLIRILQQRGLIPRRRFGGLIPIGSGNRDAVPAMLDGGEFVVRRESVNARTIRQLQSINATGRGASDGGHYTFNIQAIDSKSVEEFVKYKLAPIMKQMSGRNGIVFVNQRGVSTNA